MPDCIATANVISYYRDTKVTHWDQPRCYRWPAVNSAGALAFTQLSLLQEKPALYPKLFRIEDKNVPHKKELSWNNKIEYAGFA